MQSISSRAVYLALKTAYIDVCVHVLVHVHVHVCVHACVFVLHTGCCSRSILQSWHWLPVQEEMRNGGKWIGAFVMVDLVRGVILPCPRLVLEAETCLPWELQWALGPSQIWSFSGLLVLLKATSLLTPHFSLLPGCWSSCTPLISKSARQDFSHPGSALPSSVMWDRNITPCRTTLRAPSPSICQNTASPSLLRTLLSFASFRARSWEPSQSPRVKREGTRARGSRQTRGLSQACCGILNDARSSGIAWCLGSSMLSRAGS